MRYLLPTLGGGKLEDEVARYFGRAANFVIIFEEDGQFRIEGIVPNTYREIEFPGENTARLAASRKDINVALADNMVDDSKKVLENAGIRVSLGHHRVSLRQAIKDYLKKSG